MEEGSKGWSRGLEMKVEEGGTDLCEVTWIFTGQRICFPGEMVRRRRRYMHNELH